MGNIYPKDYKTLIRGIPKNVARLETNLFRTGLHYVFTTLTY